MTKPRLWASQNVQGRGEQVDSPFQGGEDASDRGEGAGPSRNLGGFHGGRTGRQPGRLGCSLHCLENKGEKGVPTVVVRPHYKGAQKLIHGRKGAIEDFF